MSKPLLAILVVDALLAIGVGYFAWTGQTAVCVTAAVATFLIAGWQLLLLSSLRDAGQTVTIVPNIRPPHFVQAFCHISLYVYWGLYWNEVLPQVPLILFQLAFAFAIDMLMSWSQLQPWRAGFGPLPIVGSINLFLWFLDEYYAFQLGMIVIAYLSKTFLVWKRPDRAGHIFNPSAFPMAVACVAMLAFGAFDVSRGVDIIETLSLPPSMFEVIFLLGLIVQLRFDPVFVSIGTVLGQVAFFETARALLGMPISPSPINISVFLALTFLVTDPATSPRTPMGKFLCGIAYGLGVYVICVLLRLSHQPSFIDKILMVIPVNLLAPMFDAAGSKYHRWIANTAIAGKPLLWRFAGVGVYSLMFLVIVPALKNPLPRPDNLPIPRAAIRTSASVTQVLLNKEYCRTIVPEPYRPFHFRSEVANYRRIKEVYYRGGRFGAAQSSASSPPAGRTRGA